MDYLSVAEAQSLPGLRLALTAGVPAPYSMSARAILDLHGVPYVPVEQQGGGSNEALVAWTGHRNAPVAVYENEAPRTGWLEILNLAERLGSGPSLFPDELGDRMAMVGLVDAMIGEGGMLWHMRIIMLGLGGPERAAKEAERNPMYKDYGYSEKNKATAMASITPVVDALEAQFQSQQSAGRQYLFGNRLSAADVYWVYFSQLFRTLPEEICAMPSFLRKSYDMSGEAVGGCSEALIAHRDFVLQEHLSVPLTF